ncbi:hypothetical protein DNU06_15885 [Putridiphycobacter roseus]|uniref:DUF4345 domain-containing protein n=1 Tax=Putridiphycobacter roseus TaxID=2219161 RepID=A0A2W1MXG7_9FLAO|nr:hypothetical protein DNU06_15885 [Putridiphycobacter roseus]
MEIHFKVIGIALIILACVHVIFPKYFNWKEELKSLSLINKQMMQVHTFFVALVVFLMGCLCLTSSTALVETNLGKTISLGFAIFWTMRLFLQFFAYAKELWKGKTFETVMHIVFTLFWIYLSVIFWMNYLY